MIDPLTSLAFSMCSNKGVYAILLGSGVSRSACIPTGWEITLDLVRRMAVVQGKSTECDPNPAAWYHAQFGKDPDYSELLGVVGHTAEERHAILRAYFEPTEEDRDAGHKLPTEAHRAVASLIASGHVRVVLTTNFDRLLEHAMTDLGLQPNVVSTPDAVEGAVPLAHCDHCVIKLHGDYLDTRIRNTVPELSEYDGRMDSLLDRVLDEFGLVVCGWSAEWDVALRRAIERCRSRRYTTYWVAVGDVTDAATRLVAQRAAVLIPSTGADHFFPALDGSVAAIERSQRKHPQTAAAAVAALKRYIAEDRYRIRLHDLVMDEAERVRSIVFGSDFPVHGSFAQEEMNRRIECFESATAVLRQLVAQGVYWSRGDHMALWQRTLTLLASRPDANACLVVWRDLQIYPALILFYAGALASIAADDYGYFASLAAATVRTDHSEEPFLRSVGIASLWANGLGEVWPDQERKFTPISNHLFPLLMATLRPLIPLEHDYSDAFDRVEYLLALMESDRREQDGLNPGGTIGRFGWNRQYRDLGRNGLASELTSQVEAMGPQAPVLASGLFGGIVERFQAAVKAIDDQVSRLTWY